jgi:hypothetical protein
MKTGNQVGQCRLACAGRTYQCDRLPLFYNQVDAVKYHYIFIFKACIFEFDLPGKCLHLYPIQILFNGQRGIHDLLDPLNGCPAFSHVAERGRE